MILGTLGLLLACSVVHILIRFSTCAGWDAEICQEDCWYDETGKSFLMARWSNHLIAGCMRMCELHPWYSVFCLEDLK